ncbi:hypothetical protein HBH98_040160 [Parastagonospora nodorum]|nr:hypothetical protein HBH98_040160 [Parastagonospora nodorum]KAH4383484.1 hypothetical protein HBH97_077170 [Parastagonospora nodorum]KAH4408144.1 hypothetical protein HBH92_153200 [Parastagonospora nodorum]KAH4442279.1 hypothetical protein HBH93_077210 [Parastagonospora nodorum]KAH4454085.1 hypothetical protein HBH91_105440 [Parastagonospora nodorum]
MLGHTLFLIAAIVLPVLATPVSSNDVTAKPSAIENRTSGPVIEILRDDVAKRDALPLVPREKASYDIIVDSEDDTTEIQDNESLDDLDTRRVREGSGNGRRVVRPGNGNGRRGVSLNDLETRRVRGGSGNGRRGVSLNDLEIRRVRGGSGNGRRVVRPGNGNGRRVVRPGSGNGRRSVRGGNGNA